eukprot:tig00020704_g13155.t1
MYSRTLRPLDTSGVQFDLWDSDEPDIDEPVLPSWADTAPYGSGPDSPARLARVDDVLEVANEFEHEFEPPARGSPDRPGAPEPELPWAGGALAQHGLPREETSDEEEALLAAAAEMPHALPQPQQQQHPARARPGSAPRRGPLPYDAWLEEKAARQRQASAERRAAGDAERRWAALELEERLASSAEAFEGWLAAKSSRPASPAPVREREAWTEREKAATSAQAPPPPPAAARSAAPWPTRHPHLPPLPCPALRSPLTRPGRAQAWLRAKAEREAEERRRERAREWRAAAEREARNRECRERFEAWVAKKRAQRAREDAEEARKLEEAEAARRWAVANTRGSLILSYSTAGASRAKSPARPGSAAGPAALHRHRH